MLQRLQQAAFGASVASKEVGLAQVRFVDVTKRFGEVVVIPKLNLTIPDNKFVVLVGPSGCGKSTTLRLIAGLEEVSEGAVHIGDRRVDGLPPRDRDIAMVFQSYALYPHMTVWENMAFGLKLRRLPKDEIRTRVDEAAKILGLEELLGRRPKELSGGQRQRVAMGRAIVRRPSVFLFDEPLSNLDAKLRAEMRREIAKLHRKLETTIVYVTHDQVEAMTLGDIVVAMDKGRVQQAGPPLELYENPANRFVAGFIGSPPMNFVPVDVSRQSDGLRVRADGLDLTLDEGRFLQPESARALLGVRPSDIEVGGLESQSGAGPAARATVDVREPMGAEVYLTLDTKFGEVQARVDTHHVAQVGDRVGLSFRRDKVHLFDETTGESLRRESGAAAGAA